MKNKKETICVIILTLLMTFMEMTALPTALFCNIIIADIEPLCFFSMFNFLTAFMICWSFRGPLKTALKRENEIIVPRARRGSESVLTHGEEA